MRFSSPIPRDAPAWLRGILEKLMSADYSSSAGTPQLGEKWRISEKPLTATSTENVFSIQRKDNTAWKTTAGYRANGQDIRDCFACYKSTGGQSMPAGLVYTTVNFATKDFDTDNAVTVGTNWVMRIPKFKGGVYSICAFVHFVDSPSPITEANLRVLKNGTTTYMMHSDSISANSEFSLSGSINIYFAEGDTFTIQVSHNAGAPRTTDVNTHMAAQRFNGSKP